MGARARRFAARSTLSGHSLLGLSPQADALPNVPVPTMSEETPNEPAQRNAPENTADDGSYIVGKYRPPDSGKWNWAGCRLTDFGVESWKAAVQSDRPEFNY